MTDGLLMRIDSPQFRAMSERVLRATELTSRLNVLPFDDEAGRAALFERLEVRWPKSFCSTMPLG